MEVKIKKLVPEAKMPYKATKGAAAFDLYTVRDTTIPAKSRKIVPTGLAMEIQPGYAVDVRPRSGFSAKGIEGKLTIDSEPARFDADVLLGLVDEDYRGEVGIMVSSQDNNPFIIPAGTRLAQMTIHKVEDVTLIEAEELSSTERGEGGFGSTNK